MAVSSLVLAKVESAMAALVTMIVVLLLPFGFVVVGSVTRCDVTDVNSRIIQIFK